jgi:dGTPase
LGELGTRFLARTQPGLEAQLANLADGIAYNNHDVDDGLRSGLITVDQLTAIAAFRRCWNATAAAHPGLPARRAVHETVRRMIGELVADLIDETARRIAAAGVVTIDDVRARSEPLVGFSAERQAEVVELKRFLRQELYQHERVRSMTALAQRVVTELFAAYRDAPDLLPPDHAEAAARAAAAEGASGQARAVSDYIAGMTDRFALAEHARLTGVVLAPSMPG